VNDLLAREAARPAEAPPATSAETEKPPEAGTVPEPG